MAEEKINTRKTNIDVIDPRLDIVNFLLKAMTSDELEYCSTLARGENYKLLVSIVDKFTKKNIEEVFSYMARDDADLAHFRDSKRGGVAALRGFLIVCQQAHEEISRRKKK